MTTSAYPIPEAGLDDRLAFVGTSGSGKTYAAGTAVEKILARHGRVVVVDPLGVWWGLRLDPDGRSGTAWPIIIFGGLRGDLPLNEAAGRTIGETAATMRESAIVDLSGFGTKSAERRFMLAFLEALYRAAPGEPFHLVIDEADLFAPQKASEPQLQSLMEQIVRRGRVKGFIPWLITQRPAVISKDVLSQADGIVAMKLTASQDRDAVGGWIEGQADRQEGKAMLARLPQLERGEAMVWIPGRGVLAGARFPAKATFDSSRTPKRGEKRAEVTLKPIDIGAVREKLAAVEAEQKANDPTALKAEVARLTRELAAAKAAGPGAAAPAEAIAAAEARGAERERKTLPGAIAEVEKHLSAAIEAELRESVVAFVALGETLRKAAQDLAGEARLLEKAVARARVGARLLPVAAKPAAEPAPRGEQPARRAPVRSPGVADSAPPDGVTPAKMQILTAIAELAAMGRAEPDKAMVAWIAGASPKSSGFANNLGGLRSAGLITYPQPGAVALSDAGAALVPPIDMPPDHAAMMERVGRHLSPAEMRILKAVAERYPEPLTNEEVAAAAGVSPTSSGYANNRGRLRSLGLIDYPAPGMLVATEVLFP